MDNSSVKMHHFCQNGNFLDCKETIVRGWKDGYLKELRVQERKHEPINISELPEKQREHPLELAMTVLLTLQFINIVSFIS